MKGEIKKEIESIWVYFGKEAKTLNLEGRSFEDLEEIFKKMKAIKYALDVLFSEQSSPELASAVLTNIFLDGREGEVRRV